MKIVKKERPYVVLEVIVWYAVLVYFLYVIKNPVNIYVSGLVLLVLIYLACVLCPVFRYSTGFRRMLGKK